MSRTPALWSARAHMPTIMGRQIVIERGAGSYVFTADGQRLFDATAGLWHTNIGHERQEMAEVAYEQMKRLETFHVFGRYLNDRAVELAEKLVEIAPIADAKVILNSGGSDSIDVACKLVRRYWTLMNQPNKKVIISREHAYHGLHAYGTSIAGLDFNREGYSTESLVPDTIRVDKHDLAHLEAEILRIGPDRIAAYIAEPVMGTGGVHPPREEYFAGVRRLCDEHDILFIADEVITGFGRSGEMFASTRYKLQPDIVAFAKGVTSGYGQLGGIFVAPRLWEPFFRDDAKTPIFRHGSTYSGHATSAALALKNLEIIDREQLVDRVAHLEMSLRKILAPVAARDDVTEIRIGGFMAGIELHETHMAESVTDKLLGHGFMTRPLRGNTIQLSPSFIAEKQELTDLASALCAVLDS